jgi:hypothetical protein
MSAAATQQCRSFSVHGDTPLRITVLNRKAFYDRYVNLDNNNVATLVVHAIDHPNGGSTMLVRVPNIAVRILQEDINVIMMPAPLDSLFEQKCNIEHIKDPFPMYKKRNGRKRLWMRCGKSDE